MRERLTDRAVREAEPPQRRLCRYVWDDQVIGFGLCLTRAGARSFVVRYRVDGRERKLTIGAYPDWPVSAAREEAKRIKRAADLGGDPLGTRDERRSAPIMAELVARYLTEHASRKADHAYRDQQSLMRRFVLPRLGKLRIDEVKHADIDRLHQYISEKTPIQANRVAQVLRKMFNLAILWEYRTDNPVTGLVFNPEPPRHRYLTEDEIRRLTAVLADHPNRRCANVIRMLLLTGARKSEVMKATWDQFDLEGGVWTKPSAHTKQRRELGLEAEQSLLVARLDQLVDQLGGGGEADAEEYVVLIACSGIDKTHSDPAAGLTTSEWQTKARLTPSSRPACADGLTKEQWRPTPPG